MCWSFVAKNAKARAAVPQCHLTSSRVQFGSRGGRHGFEQREWQREWKGEWTRDQRERQRNPGVGFGALFRC